MDFNEQMTILKQSLTKSIGQSRKVKPISPEKWKKLMMKCLVKLKQRELYDKIIIEDMMLVISSIQEDKFIEAILHISSLTPNFHLRHRRNSKLQKTNDIIQTKQDGNHLKKICLSKIFIFKQEIESKMNETISQIIEVPLKESVLEQTLALIIQEQALTKQFQSKHHPFRKIIDQYVFLLEHKYKNFIESLQGDDLIQIVQQKLLLDLNFFQQFIIKSSTPYFNILKSKDKLQKQKFQIRMIIFMKEYIQKHKKLNHVIKKIMKFAVKRTKIVKIVQQRLPNSIDIKNTSIPERFQIEGCYIHSINTLIEFTQCLSSKQSLQKLHQFRQNLLKDINEYYESQDKQSQSKIDVKLELTSETQLQIIKYILCKLQVFLIQIYGELKYLQIVLGQDDISYKYDDSSYMYAQITVAFETLILQYN